MKTLVTHFRLITVILILMISHSCQDLHEEVIPTNSVDDVSLQQAEITKLGKQLENPYSVENMKKALENLKTKATNSRARSELENIEIKPTHYYVKFIPETEEELEILTDDTTLFLSDIPFEYEVEQQGDYYRESNLAEGQPTPQYCMVLTDYDFPEGIAYEVLDKMYDPEVARNTDRGRVFSQDIQEALEAQSSFLVGDYESETEADGDGSAETFLFCGRKWRPSGRIRVWDDVVTTTRTQRIFVRWEYYPCEDDCRDKPCLYAFPDLERLCKRAVYRTERVTISGSYVPLVGVEVRAHRWGIKISKGITNANGFYSGDKTFCRNNSANYKIKWEKYHFSVRSGTFGQAWLNGPKQKSDWNVDIGRRGATNVNDKQQYYALIFQAAYDYYYGNRFGLSSPPQNGTWKPQVKISASQTNSQHEKPSHAAPYARTLGILPTIYIRNWNDRSDRVYAVTTHELAHSAHWDMDRDAFRSIIVNAYIPPFNWLANLRSGSESYAAIPESWANGVEWQFAQQRYRNLFGIGGYEYRTGTTDGGNYQELEINEDPIYTSIVVDMIDNENQRFSRNHNGNVAFPNDRVFGYTIQQVEQGLRGARSWNQWRDNMRNRHNNSTENRLNELFANWH